MELSFDLEHTLALELVKAANKCGLSPRMFALEAVEATLSPRMFALEAVEATLASRRLENVPVGTHGPRVLQNAERVQEPLEMPLHCKIAAEDMT